MKSLSLLQIAVIGALSTMAAVSGVRAAGSEAVASCADALDAAISIRDDSGRWLAESRELRSRAAHAQGTPQEGVFRDEVRASGLKYTDINQRLNALGSGLFALRKSGPCAQDAAINTALTAATEFLTRNSSAQRAPLPAGLCPSSPDFNAPLVPCPVSPK
jgi:hypothetical protein